MTRKLLELFEKMHDISNVLQIGGHTFMNAVTVHEAKKDLEHLIERVNVDAEPTIICGDQGQKAVLLSLEEFNSWQETFYLLSNPANAEHLRQSIAEAKAGKTLERELIEP